MNKSTQARLSPEEVQKRHDRWNASAARRRFQKSRASANGMSWEQWQEHKQRLRDMPKSSHAEYLHSYRATPRGKKVFAAARERQMAKCRAFYNALKLGPCRDCGNRPHPEAMEWDHRDGETKSFCISYVGRGSRIANSLLRSEIAKCDLVCSNCHRVRTARRRAGLSATPPSPEYEI